MFRSLYDTTVDERRILLKNNLIEKVKDRYLKLEFLSEDTVKYEEMKKQLRKLEDLFDTEMHDDSDVVSDDFVDKACGIIKTCARLYASLDNNNDRLNLESFLEMVNADISSITSFQNDESKIRSIRRLVESTTIEDLEVLGFSKVTMRDKQAETGEAGKFNIMEGEWIDKKLHEGYYDIHRLHRRSPNADEFFSLAMGACAEIMKIHDMGLLHCNISPPSMMYNVNTGKVTVTNFSAIAKMKDGVCIGQKFGIDHFLSGEIKNSGEHLKKYTIGSDVFSLSRTLQHILTMTNVSDYDRYELNQLFTKMESYKLTAHECFDEIYKIYTSIQRSHEYIITSKRLDIINGDKVDIQYKARKIIEVLQEKRKNTETSSEEKEKLHKIILKIQVIASGDTSGGPVLEFVKGINGDMTAIAKKEEVITSALRLQYMLEAPASAAVTTAPAVPAAPSAPVTTAPAVPAAPSAPVTAPPPAAPAVPAAPVPAAPASAAPSAPAAPAVKSVTFAGRVKGYFLACFSSINRSKSNNLNKGDKKRKNRL